MIVIFYIATTELTRSFGWNTVDAFMQRDVQEFNRLLQENLERKMKGTPADGSIKKLFVGKMKSYVKCINVEYESSRTEDYYGKCCAFKLGLITHSIHRYPTECKGL